MTWSGNSREMSELIDAWSYIFYINRLCYHWLMQWLGSCNGLPPAWHQALARCQAGVSHSMSQSNDGLCSIETSNTPLSEIWIKIQKHFFNIRHLKMLSATWQPFCSGFNVWRTSNSKPNGWPTSAWKRIDIIIFSHANKHMIMVSNFYFPYHSWRLLVAKIKELYNSWQKMKNKFCTSDTQNKDLDLQQMACTWNEVNRFLGSIFFNKL